MTTKPKPENCQHTNRYTRYNTEHCYTCDSELGPARCKYLGCKEQASEPLSYSRDEWDSPRVLCSEHDRLIDFLADAIKARILK